MGRAIEWPDERRDHSQGQGYLLKQEYQNGYFVTKGQRLFELDPRQYEAALDAAKAAVAGRKQTSRSTRQTLPATLRWLHKTRFR